MYDQGEVSVDKVNWFYQFSIRNYFIYVLHQINLNFRISLIYMNSKYTKFLSKLCIKRK